MLVLKDVLYLVQTEYFGGGGLKSSSQTRTLQTLDSIIQVICDDLSDLRLPKMV